MTQIPNYTKIAYKTKPGLGIIEENGDDLKQIETGKRRKKSVLSVIQMFNVEANRHRIYHDPLSTWSNFRENLPNISSTRRHSEGYSVIGRRGSRLSVPGICNDNLAGNLFSSSKDKRYSEPREHHDIKLTNSRRSSVVSGLLGSAAFKRQVTKKTVKAKRRLRLYKKFKMLGRLTILLYRMCRLHFQELKDDEEDSNAMSFAQIAFHGKRDPTVDLLFDVSKFKANKELRISSDFKTIMKTHPNERTEDDIHTIKRTLLDLKSFAEYPVKMQLNVSKVGWYQTFNPKRVIIREGHPPQSFFFLISGSVLITSTNDSCTDGSKSISMLKRGDSFGDLAILQDTKRTFTATASEKVELFCVSRKDFISIFMAGGEKKLKDPELLKFIKNLEILENWPIELLEEHPEKCVFNYYKHGTLLIEDSNANDRIFIVKSGSCTVLKKLKCRTAPPREKHSHQHEDCVAEDTESTKHKQLIEQKEKLFLKRKIKSLKKVNASIYERGLNLPLLRTNHAGVGVHDRAGSMLSIISERDSLMSHDYILRDDIVDDPFSGSSSSRSYYTSHEDDVRYSAPYLSRFNERRQAVENDIEQSHVFCTERPPPNRPKKNVESWLSDLPISSENRLSHNRDVEGKHPQVRNHQLPPQIHINPHQDDKLTLLPLSKKLKDNSSSVMSTSSEVNKVQVFKPCNRSVVFIEVQKLHKGDVFGLSNDLFANQPAMSLVSDGAECLVLSKQFFLENATDFQIHKIRIAGAPYPTDQEMQENLDTHEAWKAYRNKILTEVINDVTWKRRKKKTQLSGHS